MTNLNPISIIIITWLATAVALTLAWMVLVTIRNRWGSLGNFFIYHLRKYLKP